jgi:hypothetical protein
MTIKTETRCVLWPHPMGIFELQNISLMENTKHYNYTELAGISKWI